MHCALTPFSPINIRSVNWTHCFLCYFHWFSGVKANQSVCGSGRSMAKILIASDWRSQRQRTTVNVPITDPFILTPPPPVTIAPNLSLSPLSSIRPPASASAITQLALLPVAAAQPQWLAHQNNNYPAAGGVPPSSLEGGWRGLEVWCIRHRLCVWKMSTLVTWLTCSTSTLHFCLSLFTVNRQTSLSFFKMLLPQHRWSLSFPHPSNLGNPILFESQLQLHCIWQKRSCFSCW